MYCPLRYAKEPHEEYLSRYGAGPKRIVMLGMNPGPWGMAQTGVPFGEVCHVREWLGITGRVRKPEGEHPKRPVTGFECTRSEVSGRRLWSLFAEEFTAPERFFADHFVANYCPLVFMESTGRNRTPDKLPAAERSRLFDACDDHLNELIRILEPEWVIGIGKFAEKRAAAVLDPMDKTDAMDATTRMAERTANSGPEPPKVAGILHPSPANPRANRGWAAEVRRTLSDYGIWS